MGVAATVSKGRDREALYAFAATLLPRVTNLSCFLSTILRRSPNITKFVMRLPSHTPDKHRVTRQVICKHEGNTSRL